ncbi:hypothetical protein GMMP1_910022 [Candidatus Magnetomoraceae bacterium gMMP-1]
MDKKNSSMLSFHAQYTLFIILVFILVISAFSFIMIKQNNLNRKYEQELLMTNFHERISYLDSLLARVNSRVKGLYSESEANLLESRWVKNLYPPVTFEYLKNNTSEEYFHLDEFMPPIVREMIGNLTGDGSIKQRSRDYYREIYMALNLNPRFRAIKREVENAAWVYYTSANGFINIYPWVSSNDFKFTEELYSHEFYILGLPKNDPDRKLFWTNVYVDEYGKGLMTSCAMPVYDGDRFLGTIAIDLTVDFLNTILKDFMTKHGYNKGIMFFANDRDQVLAHPTLISSGDKQTKSIQEAFPKPLRNYAERLMQIRDNEIAHINSFTIMRSQLHNAPWQAFYIEPIPSFWISAVKRIGIWSVAVLVAILILTVITFIIIHKYHVLPSENFINYIMARIRNSSFKPRQNIPKKWKVRFNIVEKFFKKNDGLIRLLHNQSEIMEKQIEKRVEKIIKSRDRDKDINA